jgi:hypothetical protein
MDEESFAYLAAPVLAPPRQRPAEALHVLAAQLRGCGITNLYGAADRRFGVLSLPGVSVWSNGRVLWWRAKDEVTTWPAADPQGAARRLAELTGSTGTERKGLGSPQNHLVTRAHNAGR